jgi:hypothetical protein
MPLKAKAPARKFVSQVNRHGRGLLHFLEHAGIQQQAERHQRDQFRTEVHLPGPWIKQYCRASGARHARRSYALRLLSTGCGPDLLQHQVAWP